MTKILLIAGTATALASCTTVPTQSPKGESKRPCLFSGSSDWKAWVDDGPYLARATLHVRGKVKLFYAQWGPSFFIWLNSVDGEPSHATVNLAGVFRVPSVTSPKVTQVEGDWPITGPVHSVTVMCEGKKFATIRRVSEGSRFWPDGR